MEAVDRVVGARGEAVAKKALDWSGGWLAATTPSRNAVSRLSSSDHHQKSSRFKELPTFTPYTVYSSINIS